MGWQEKFDESDQGGSPILTAGVDHSASNYSDSNSEVSGVDSALLNEGKGKGKLPVMAHAVVPFIDFLGVGAI